MNWLAWKMLTGDKAKYFGIVFGITFAALLMAQQSAIFCGVMRNCVSTILDVSDGNVWVMNSATINARDIRPIVENKIYQVRSVEGVEWAVRVFRGRCNAYLADGRTQTSYLCGVDDDTLLGAPREFVAGNLEDLRAPDAISIDRSGWNYLWPGEPFKPGRVIEINDHRAVITCLHVSAPTFDSFPVIYTRYSNVVSSYAAASRNYLSFILVQTEPGFTPEQVCKNINAATGLRAETANQFMWTTVDYYLKRTGIPINFSITVGLGFFVGCAIAGQTFYLFTIENLKQFGSLKAMGVSNWGIVKIISFQAIVVAAIGYGLGLGLAIVSDRIMRHIATTVPPSFYMPWQIPVMIAALVGVIALVSSLLSIRKVLLLEPAVVFK